MKTVKIGSISEGTLLAHDLISAYLWELKSLLSVFEYQQLTEKITACVNVLDLLRSDAEGYDLDEDKAAALEILTEELESLAPQYTYFGAHHGDGACFGFWPDLDAIGHEKSRVPGADLYEVDDLCFVPEHYDGLVMLVNCHGNISMYSYQRDSKKPLLLWDCV